MLSPTAIAADILGATASGYDGRDGYSADAATLGVAALDHLNVHIEESAAGKGTKAQARGKQLGHGALDGGGRKVEPVYDKILVAVDQSPVAEQVLAAARDLARLSGGEVRVLHLRERELMGGRGGVVDYETGEEARATADRAVRALAQDGIKATGEARNTPFGHAAREIVAEAREFGAGVIVMGSRGHGDLAGLVLGSTAHKVIHLADRPVLVVR